MKEDRSRLNCSYKGYLGLNFAPSDIPSLKDGMEKSSKTWTLGWWVW